MKTTLVHLKKRSFSDKLYALYEYMTSIIIKCQSPPLPPQSVLTDPCSGPWLYGAECFHGRSKIKSMNITFACVNIWWEPYIVGHEQNYILK